MVKMKLLTAALLVFPLMVSSFAVAKNFRFQQGKITIENPVARASIGKAKNSLAFMTLYNKGAKDRILVAAKAPVSKKVELHTHLMQDGVMMMRKVKGGIKIPAGGKTVLESGGLHIMFLDLKQPLSEGGKFPLTLVFANGEEFTLPVAVHEIMEQNHKMHHNH